MVKPNGYALFFDSEDVRRTTAKLPRLIRIIFYSLGLTNDDFNRLYGRAELMSGIDVDLDKLKANATTYRTTIRDSQKLTYSMMTSVLRSMGYETEAVSIRLRDMVTGQVMTFSTDETVDSIEETIRKKREEEQNLLANL